MFFEWGGGGRCAWKKKIGKQVLICIINSVVIHIFEQLRERSRVSPGLEEPRDGAWIIFNIYIPIQFAQLELSGSPSCWRLIQLSLLFISKFNNITQRYFFFSEHREIFLQVLSIFPVLFCLLVDFNFFCIPYGWIYYTAFPKLEYIINFQSNIICMFKSWPALRTLRHI